MDPSPRVCRAMVEDRFGRPKFTFRQREREDKILAAGTQLMAHFGRGRITTALLAAALRLSPATLRWHYTDPDALLGEILRQHLRAVAKAIGDVPHDAADRQPRMRQAYLNATRGAFGRMVDAHLLLTRDRHLLPADALEDIECTLQSLAELIAGDLAEEAMDLLNRPWITQARAEPILAAMAETRDSALQAAPDPSPDASPDPNPDPAIGQAPTPPPAGPGLPPGVAQALWEGDLTWLRPAGLGTAGLPYEKLGPARTDWPGPRSAGKRAAR